MKIETDDWMPLAEAAGASGLSEAAARRLAHDLGIVQVFFGVKVIRRKDIETLQANRRRPGNQRWIADGEAAAADSLKAVANRMARLRSEQPKRRPRS